MCFLRRWSFAQIWVKPPLCLAPTATLLIGQWPFSLSASLRETPTKILHKAQSKQEANKQTNKANKAYQCHLKRLAQSFCAKHKANKATKENNTNKQIKQTRQRMQLISVTLIESIPHSFCTRHKANKENKASLRESHQSFCTKLISITQENSPNANLVRGFCNFHFDIFCCD